jgi:putative Mg2+ transporter-C (MgtC) family protein
LADAAAAEQVGRLVAAVVAGAALGLNRNLRGKAAGVRTHALVALGAALVTGAAALASGADAATRVMQGVVTGVGFIGAGVILHPGQRAAPVVDPHAGDGPPDPAAVGGARPARVRGLTTAATVWVAAALGIACGVGLWVLAVAGTLLTLAVLAGGGTLEAAVRAHLLRRRGARRPRA